MSKSDNSIVASSQNLSAPETFTSPATGEVLTLASPTYDLGRYLADVREFEATIREYKNAVQAELLARMDRDTTWTVHAPNLELVGQSPEPVEEFDELALREELLECADRGELSIEAVDKAVETVVTYKARKAGINAIRKLPGMAERIAPYTRRVEKARYVKVRRTI